MAMTSSSRAQKPVSRRGQETGFFFLVDTTHAARDLLHSAPIARCVPGVCQGCAARGAARRILARPLVRRGTALPRFQPAYPAAAACSLLRKAIAAKTEMMIISTFQPT